MAKVMSHNNKVLTDGESVFLSGEYELPPATTETLGGVIVGDGLEVEEDGTLNVTGGGGEPVAVTYTVTVNNYISGGKMFGYTGTGFIGEFLQFVIGQVVTRSTDSGNKTYLILGQGSSISTTGAFSIPLTEDGQQIVLLGIEKN